jgi:hypothetical protein
MDGGPLTSDRINQENRNAIRCSDTRNRPVGIPDNQKAVRLGGSSVPPGTHKPGPVDLVRNPEFSPGQARGGEDRRRVIGTAAVTGGESVAESAAPIQEAAACHTYSVDLGQVPVVPEP